jgi:hypothetical protein
VIALAMHGQIEVTPLWSSSAAWFCLMLGAAGVRSPTSKPSSRGLSIIAPGALAGAAAVLAWLGIAPVSRWELALGSAAAEMRPLADIRTRLRDLEPGPSEKAAKLLGDLARLTDSPPPESPQELERALAILTIKATTAAAPLLERAASLAPRHFETTESLVRLLSERAAMAALAGQGALRDSSIIESEVHARRFADRHPTSSALGLLGNVEAARHDWSGDPKLLDAAIEAWTAGARLDPHGLSLPLQVFRTLERAGRKDEARTWALRLLELDKLQRLDELKRLSPEDLAAVNQAAGRN